MDKETVKKADKWLEEYFSDANNRAEAWKLLAELESLSKTTPIHAESEIEAIKNLLHLHACEQEGLSSGQPSMEDWIKAVDEANIAIDRLSQLKPTEGEPMFGKLNLPPVKKHK